MKKANQPYDITGYRFKQKIIVPLSASRNETPVVIRELIPMSSGWPERLLKPQKRLDQFQVDISLSPSKGRSIPAHFLT